MVLLFGVSGGEIFVIILFILIFFGADKLPGIARTMGKTLRQVKDATADVQRDIRESASQVKDQVMESSREVRDSSHHVRNQIIEHSREVGMPNVSIQSEQAQTATDNKESDNRA